MKTSYTQFLIMVEFMERNGDLSKPAGGPRGRQWCIKKWQELTNKLNSEGTGESRTEEKWRKVWSDFKNNTKKKWAKINRGATGTGGGPALKISLTDLEERVMTIMGKLAATGLPIPEAGLQLQDPLEILPLSNTAEEEEVEQLFAEVAKEQTTSPLPYTGDSEWNFPGSSSQATAARPETPILQELTVSPTPQPPPPKSGFQWKPPPKKSKKVENSKVDSYRNAFYDSEKRAWEYEKERDKMMYELEKERIRQKDVELAMQAQWMEFMKEALNVLNNILTAKKGDE